MPPILSEIHDPHQIRQRDEYISGSSLGSSLEISNRLSSSLPAASRPLSLRFYSWWKARKCPVMKWYQEQSRWSTKFKSIEHRRELQAPFHHEYLLIHLDGGAICRLERMGEGTRADAIRPIGCRAHDIIQRFDKDMYNTHELSQVPSELLVQVEFPHGLDLLDILAICFSIQQVKESSVYTLQRYNCYFLCLTVLNVLTRRAAKWGSAIDRASWASAVKNTIQNLQKMKCSDGYEYLGLGICSLVNPDSSKPRKFILDSIRRELYTDGFSSLNKAIDGTLWQKDLGSVAQELSIEHAAIAVTTTDGRAMRMRRLFNDGDTLESTNASNRSNFRSEFVISVISKFARTWPTFAESASSRMRLVLSMQEIEYPQALARLLYRSMCLISLIVRIVAVTCNPNHKLWHNLEFQEVPPLLTRAWFSLRLIPVFRLAFKYGHDYFEKLGSLDEDDEFVADLKTNQIHAMITAAYETIQSPPRRTPDEVLVAIQTFFDKDTWAYCLAVCVGRQRQIQEVVRQQCIAVGLVNVDNAHPKYGNTGHMTVTEFQENYLIKRIQEHAKRVASYGLAAEKRVHNEIESTMAKVWKNMPDKPDHVELESGSHRAPWRFGGSLLKDPEPRYGNTAYKSRIRAEYRFMQMPAIRIRSVFAHSVTKLRVLRR
ncbi:hypothetical protein RSAG8_11875, partial [Rhizoctonia solani AG-8 WAC10335]